MLSKTKVLCGSRWLSGTVVVAPLLQAYFVSLCKNYEKCHNQEISLEQERKHFFFNGITTGKKTAWAVFLRCFSWPFGQQYVSSVFILCDYCPLDALELLHFQLLFSLLREKKILILKTCKALPFPSVMTIIGCYK